MDVKAILKQYWIFGAVTVACVVLVVVLNLVYSKKEVKTWSFGKVWAKNCPYLGGYPLLLKNEFPKKYHVFSEQAGTEINREIGERLSMGTVYKKLIGKALPGQIVVTIKAAPKSFYGFKKLCELFKLGDKGDATTGTGVSELQVSWKNGVLQAATIYICVDKIEKGWKLVNTPAVQRLKRIGWKGIIKHEMVHGIIGEKHPGWGGELMSYSPSSTFISKHTLKIISTHVLPACLKNGKLGK